MEQLDLLGLFTDGLFRVEGDVMVQRYNDCLHALGLEQTRLNAFGIDAMGWSPEIATERGDVHYLSAGVANELAIVLSPSQRHKPIHFGMNSFDSELMEAYFSRYRGEIADITLARGIALDIDQELTTYGSISDLRLVSSVIVRSLTGALPEVASRQRTLSDTICSSEHGWMERGLREQLLESAKQHGDLRFLRTDVPDFRFDNLGSFYTRAFGGVFVLERPGSAVRLLIVEKAPDSGSSPSLQKGVLSLSDPFLVETLGREGLYELDFAWYRAYPQVLSYLKDMLTADIVCRQQPDLDYIRLNTIQRKQRIQDLGKRVPEVYLELERLMKQLQLSSANPDTISRELRILLVRPCRRFSLETQLVLRRLLHRIHAVDVLQLHADDRTLFSDLYQTWPTAKQEWSMQKIKQDS